MRLSACFALLSWIGGCSWVGKADYEARLGEVDDDADGDPAATDCDDHDPAISTGAPETWYDGIDEACDGGDDFDQDLDGIVPDEYAGRATEGVDGTGGLPGGDCDDTDPLISPEQPDAAYSGVDENCDGLDDYDQDGDGYVSDENEGLSTEYVTGSGALPGGDCDDAEATVGPGQPDEWYDGVDTDCAGNDDWDQDDDGFIPIARYDEYGETTYVDGSGHLPNGDCDDTLANFNPLAEDAWYDGLDADCAGDDDYDQDLDGFDARSGGGDDCDDLDADVYPGAVETIGDGEDADCDGGVDTFALSPVDGYSFVAPQAPVFAETTDRVYLSVAAVEIDSSSTPYYDSAVAVLWTNDDPSDGQDGVTAWSTSVSDSADYVLGPGQAFLATDDYLYGVLGFDYGDDRAMRLVRYDISAGSKLAANANATDGLTAFDHVDAALDDDGALHVLGCEDDTEVLHYVRVPSTWSGGFSADVEVEGIGAADCALSLHGGEAHVFTSEHGGIWDYPFDPTASDPTFTGAEYSSAYAPLDLDIPAEWTDRTLVIADATTDAVVLLEDSGVTSLAEGEVPLEVDAAEADDGTLYVAYVTPGGDAHLAWGTSASGFEEIVLDPGFSVDDVAVWPSGDYVLYAAVGASDVAVGVARR